MKIIEAIKKGFEIAGKSMAVVLILFVFNVVWNLATISFVPTTPPAGGVAVPVSPILAVLSIIFILLSIFIQGGVLASIKDVIKEGKTQLNKFAGYGAKFYLRLLGLALLIVLIIGIAALVATLIATSSAPTANKIIIAIAAIIALVIGGIAVYLVVLLFFSPYILVADEVGVIESMKRSIAFARERLLKVIGLGLILVLIGLGVGFIIGIVMGFLSLAIKGKAFQVIMAIVSSGANAYLSLVITAALMSYYLALGRTK